MALITQAVDGHDNGGYQFAGVNEIIVNAVERHLRAEREAAAGAGSKTVQT